MSERHRPGYHEVARARGELGRLVAVFGAAAFALAGACAAALGLAQETAVQAPAVIVFFAGALAALVAAAICAVALVAASAPGTLGRWRSWASAGLRHVGRAVPLVSLAAVVASTIRVRPLGTALLTSVAASLVVLQLIPAIRWARRTLAPKR